MLQRSKAVFLMAGLTAGFLLGQAAQPPSQPPAASPDETPVFRSDIRLVDLHASVFDKSGKLVTNIPQSAFKVYENGVEHPIKVFRREDVPVSMGIILDNSG